jgi:hypothetical protein
MLLPEYDCTAVGENVIETMQLAPGATELQLLVFAVNPVGRLTSAALQLKG